ncbi:MAG: hypothetical protein AB8H80_06855 [Planctomycetota bacterium]
MSAPIRAQAAWRHVGSSPSERQEPPLCYDSLRSRSVVYGGYLAAVRLRDTWSYEASATTPGSSTPGVWSRIDVPDGPELFSPFTAYDRSRDRVVLFGFTMVPGNRVPKTYEFDGARWLDRDPPNAPDPTLNSTRSLSLAFDENRGVTVMVIGDETWEWNGVDWLQSFPATAPFYAYGQSLVYHAGRGRVVFVNTESNPPRTVLREWDGTDWQLVDNSGPDLNAFGLTYDRARDRLVVFGGRSSAFVSSDETWEWDGAVWAQRAPATVPAGRYSCSLSYDEQRNCVVMVGGSTMPNSVGRLLRRQVWEWDGVDWRETTPPAPEPREDVAFTYDLQQDRWLQFGGNQNATSPSTRSDETWVYDEATGWTELQLAVRPGPAGGHLMTYDEARSAVVMGSYDGLWEFSNGAWSQQTPFGSSIGNLLAGGLVYDSLRSQCVLLQTTPVGTSMRMFSWDGSNVFQIGTATLPSDRQDFAMSYDRRRDEIVLFGGRVQGGFALLGDTWIYDGVDWRLAAINGPPARDQSSMVYDVARDRTVLHGGRYNGPSQTGETWEWNGMTWRVASTAAYRPRHGALAYDPRNRRVAGLDSVQTRLWLYETQEPARVDSYGSGCAGSNGVLDLESAAGGLPWFGDTMRLRLASVPGPSAAASALLLGVAPLGIDLTSLGAPSCSLLVDPFLVLPMQAAGSGVGLDVPLGAAAALVGLPFYGQAMALDSSANALGLVSSQGVEIVVGVR